MTKPADCTCQSNCGYVLDNMTLTTLTVLSACGPSGTGCTCPKGKCDCKQCVNAPHSRKVLLFPSYTKLELTLCSATAAVLAKIVFAPHEARFALVNPSSESRTLW